ncbi:MAG TPA: response regulator, partial [Xenococcaceae cyanobacterium]
MTVETDNNCRKILLVEDNIGDIRLIQEVLKDSLVFQEILTVRDGMDAMAFLRHKEAYQDAPRPDLIVLDLNLP